MNRSIFSLGMLLLLLAFAACTSGTGGDAQASLQEFYQEYIRESSKMPLDGGKIAALKQKHCTAKLLQSLENAELDADPFLNTQDVDAAWADALQISPKAEGKYQVCFQVGAGAQHCVSATMKEESGGWKIDEVAF